MHLRILYIRKNTVGIGIRKMMLVCKNYLRTNINILKFEFAQITNFSISVSLSLSLTIQRVARTCGKLTVGIRIPYIVPL